MRTGIMAEFLTPEEMVAAIHALRRRGYGRLDAFSPYPVKGAEQALGLPRSRLSFIVFPFAMLGAALAYLLQWFCNAYDYPINVGGRPPNSPPAFIPITFEMGVLSASISGVIVFLVLSNLPELHAPVFDVEGFGRASIDRFWVGIDDRDPQYNEVQIERDLRDLGAASIHRARRRS
jgi:hypothetical protein